MSAVPPLVSVVIPTYDRPQLLLRAVHSALAQSLHDIEVIVVFDGSPAATRSVLASISDSRLWVLSHEQNQGAPAARTTGVKAARADWIASLDDDDEWDPYKLEVQWQHARQSTAALPIVPCRFVARTDSGDFLWPRRWPRPNEPISEYLFCSSSLTFGEAVLPSSVLFAPRQLFELEPPRCTEARHDDLDWLLRAVSHQGVAIDPVPEERPLAVWNRQHRPAVKRSPDWRPSVEWVNSYPNLITPRARSAFLLRWVGSVTAKHREWDSFWPVLREAVLNGRAAALDVAVYLAHWLLPHRVSNLLASRTSRGNLRPGQ